MKKVLILTSKKMVGITPTKLDESMFEANLNKALKGEVQVTIASLTELIFQAGPIPRIWHPTGRYDIADFDAVIIRKVGIYLELGIAAAHYLKSKNIPFGDSYLMANGNGKLACAMIRSIDGLPVPMTLVGPIEELLKLDLLEFPCVVKADISYAGRDNFLVQNATQYRQIHKQYKDTIMVTQAFIPNQGDFRILVLGDKPALAILRKGDGSTHLNNTSQGGSATLIEIDVLPPQILEDALKATSLENLHVAGVDMMINDKTGEHVIIEVNRAPQIPSGSFIPEKVEAYADFIKQFASSKPIYTDARLTIGRAENVEFPEIISNKIKARIDTGAKTSSIWAKSHIQSDGRLAVNFLGPSHPHYTGDMYYFEEFDDTVVASSTGQEQHRYKIRLSVRIGRKRVRAWFTLADRSTQVYPVLIGRNVLLRKFIVDVHKGKPDRESERMRTKELRMRKGK